MKLLVRIGEQSGTRREGVGERITEARYLLNAPAEAASNHFWPTMPRYWDWHDDLGFDFELVDDVEHPIRSLVREEGLERTIFLRTGNSLTSRSDTDHDRDHQSRNSL